MSRPDPHDRACEPALGLAAVTVGVCGSLLGAGYLIEDAVLPGRIEVARLLGQSDHPGLSRIPIRIDCGTADPFQPAAKRFASGLHPAALSDLVPEITPGVIGARKQENRSNLLRNI